MELFFKISFPILCVAVFLQAAVLQKIIEELARLLRIYNGRQTRRKLAFEKEIPAPELLGSEILNLPGLQGHRSMLVFVSSDDKSAAQKTLSAAIHAWYHETDGHVYLVCAGTEQQCGNIAVEVSVNLPHSSSVGLILDEDSSITKSCGVVSTPQAMELDEMAAIVRYGRPEETEGDSANSSLASRMREVILQTNARDPNEVPSFQFPDFGVHGVVRSSDGHSTCLWPDDRPDTGAAYARVETSVSCLLTRFRLRSLWALIPFYIAFRRVRRSAREVDGLINSSFLIENLHTCYTMSLWRDECSIVEFSSRVRTHIGAVRSAFGRTSQSALRRPEIWSAQFRLWAISEHNLQWRGLNLAASMYNVKHQGQAGDKQPYAHGQSV